MMSAKLAQLLLRLQDLRGHEVAGLSLELGFDLLADLLALLLPELISLILLFGVL